MEHQQPSSDMRKEFEELRNLMIKKGAKYPPEPPAKVREWMKSQGLNVAEWLVRQAGRARLASHC